MCDFNLISGLIIGAQTAFLASLVIVGAVILLGSNPFTSAANIPAMVTAGILSVLAAGGIAGAIAALDACTNGPCGAALVDLKANLIALSIAMGVYGGILIALAIVAGVPVLSSVTAATVLAYGATLVPLFAAYESGNLGNTIQTFNDCLQRASQTGNNTTTTVVVVLSIIVTIVAVFVSAGSGYSGTKAELIKLPKWW